MLGLGYTIDGKEYVVCCIYDTYGGKVEIHLRYQRRPPCTAARGERWRWWWFQKMRRVIEASLLICGLEFSFGLIANLCPTGLHRPAPFWRTKFSRTTFWPPPRCSGRNHSCRGCKRGCYQILNHFCKKIILTIDQSLQSSFHISSTSMTMGRRAATDINAWHFASNWLPVSHHTAP